MQYPLFRGYIDLVKVLVATLALMVVAIAIQPLIAMVVAIIAGLGPFIAVAVLLALAVAIATGGNEDRKP